MRVRYVYVQRATVNEDSCNRARRAHSLGQGFRTFIQPRPISILKIFLGLFFIVLLNRNFPIFWDLYAISKKSKKTKKGLRTGYYKKRPPHRVFQAISKKKKSSSPQKPQFSPSFLTTSEGKQGHRANKTFFKPNIQFSK